jgi:hypothetical protein
VQLVVFGAMSNFSTAKNFFADKENCKDNHPLKSPPAPAPAVLGSSPANGSSSRTSGSPQWPDCGTPGVGQRSGKGGKRRSGGGEKKKQRQRAKSTRESLEGRLFDFKSIREKWVDLDKEVIFFPKHNLFVRPTTPSLFFPCSLSTLSLPLFLLTVCLPQLTSKSSRR